jgi:hypothetical protein
MAPPDKALTPDDRRVFLIESLKGLLKQKQNDGAWGETTIAITWQNGLPKTASITDSGSFHFEKGGPAMDRVLKGQ